MEPSPFGLHLALPERNWEGLPGTAWPSAATDLGEYQNNGVQVPGSVPFSPSTKPPSVYCPEATPPTSLPCYRLDQQLQVPGLKGVLILRIQMFKLLQEAQVIQLYIWKREKY